MEDLEGRKREEMECGTVKGIKFDLRREIKVFIYEVYRKRLKNWSLLRVVKM